MYRKFIRPLIHKLKRFRNFVRSLVFCLWRGWDIRLVCACDIHLSKVPRTTRFAHPVGVVISSKVKMGEHCSIRHNVTLGLRDDDQRQYPTVGNHVHVGAGAMILGGVTVGDHAVIGAGAIVLEDVPAGAHYYCRLEPVLKLPQEAGLQGASVKVDGESE